MLSRQARLDILAAAFSVVVASLCSMAHAETTIVMPGDLRHDAGISLAVRDLTSALMATGKDVTTHEVNADKTSPAGDRIVLRLTDEIATNENGEKSNERFVIEPQQTAGERLVAIQGQRRGLMYGTFKLAERVRLGDDPWQVKLDSTPAFPLRIFSEQGQLLDIPDKSYYADESPYVNEQRLRDETDQLKQLMRHVASLGFNAFCILHLNVEEYIDYRYLDKEVYAADDPHRVRSPIFCKYLKELCDEAHSLHMEFHLQLYEFIHPPRLAELYNLDLDHPDLATVLNARYKELFERVPVDRIIVTAGEQAPRCGYVPRLFWGGSPEENRARAGKMAKLYHNACEAAGGKCIFRLWHVAPFAEAAEVFAMAGPNVTFETKHTGGDFFISFPLTNIIANGLTKKQPTVVTFDTFRQYDGWSRLFCFMKQWGPRVQACRDNGVIGINAWGPWSPACNVRDIPGISWAGHWNSFRTFLRGFTPGQAHVYLLSRLAWDPDADVAQIARDLCALHLGRANAEYAADALMATEDAFGEEYVKQAHPCYLRLAMLYQPRDAALDAAYSANSLDDILASNARGLDAVDRMEQAFSRTHAADAPNADTYQRFEEGIQKTALYLRTFYTLREGFWRSHAAKTLVGNEKDANSAALTDLRSRLKSLFDQWHRWPEEAGFWRVTYRFGKPPEASYRYFEVWNSEEHRTMETDAERFGKDK